MRPLITTPPFMVFWSRRSSPVNSPGNSPPDSNRVANHAFFQATTSASRGLDLLQQAEAEVANGDTPLAQAIYMQAAELLLDGVNIEQNPQEKQRLRERATQCVERAEALARLAQMNGASTSVSSSAPSSGRSPLYPTATAVSSPPPPPPAPPAVSRQSSSKLWQIEAIRATLPENGLKDHELRLLLAKHGDDVDEVINELLEEMISQEMTHEQREQQREQQRAPDMWQCAVCTLENRMEEQLCSACDAPRGEHVDAAISAATATSSLPSSTGLRGGPGTSKRRVVIPPPPATMEEFQRDSSILGDVRLMMHLQLPSGGVIEREVSMPAAQMRALLVQLSGSVDAAGGSAGGGAGGETANGVPRQAWPEGAGLPKDEDGRSGMHRVARRAADVPSPQSRTPPRPRSQTPPPHPHTAPPGPSAPPASGPSGVPAGAREVFSTPTANQGAFGGERVGLPQHASRKAAQRTGPRQAPLADVLSVRDVKAQLGDATVQSLVESALDKRDRDDGNAPVNPDIAADTPLYDDGVGGQYERSVFIDPKRGSKRSKAGRGGGAGARPLSEQIKVEPPPAGEDARALPVAYEVAAVGARLANMARVGGQRVQEMDHFVESTATPIVRLVLPGASGGSDEAPTDSRDAMIQSRKVLERKFLASAAAGCPAIALDAPDAPPLRLLTALGDDDTGGGGGGGGAPPHVKAYADIFWSVLEEVVVRIMGRRAVTDVVSGLYSMPTIRADVFVCSAVSQERGGTGLHLNALVFQQSLCCECEGGGTTRPLRIAPARWAEVLPYWLCRVTSALNESHPGTARGIYDADVRARLVERIVARSSVGSGPATAANLRKDPVQSWTPPALPTTLLTSSGSKH